MNNEILDQKNDDSDLFAKDFANKAKLLSNGEVFPMTPAEINKELPKENFRKSLFINLNTDLKSAMNTWDVINEQSVQKVSTQKVSTQQEPLNEVKKLLSELKSKLAEFSE